MCFFIFFTSVAYSSFEYCLLRMQYCLFFRPTQQKRAEDSWQQTQYSNARTSFQHSTQNFRSDAPQPQVVTSYISSALEPMTLVSMQFLDDGTCEYCTNFRS